MSRFGADFFRRSPEAHGSISYGKFGRVHSSLFEIEKDFTPALGGLAHPVLNGQELFLPTGIYTDHDEGAEFVVFTAQATVDAVSPDIDPLVIVQRPVSPAIVFICPIPLEPRHRVRRQPLGFRAQKNLESSSHLATGNTLQIQPR